ncbi:MAG: CHASE2 domain-containing protein [Bacteriodetes bacterium]|nr:CHASE2 domain-containing protein [Bacteroidota bacterium]
MKHLFKLDTLFTCLFIFGTVVLLFNIPTNFDFINPLKMALGDFDITDMAQSQYREDSEIQVDTNIVLVNISSLQRDYLASMINIISQQKPKVIGIDAFFRSEKNPEADTPLVAAIQEAGNVVLGCELQYNTNIDAWDTILQSHRKFVQHEKAEGYVNTITNQEVSFRTVREFSPSERFNDSVVYNFSVVVAKQFAPQAVRSLLQRNNTTESIYFRGNYNKFYVFDSDQIFDLNSDLSVLKDKIVLMGYMGETLDTTVRSLEDVFFTPLNERYAGKTFPDMYGVIVHANVISQILHGLYYTVMPKTLSIVLSVVLVLLNVAIFNAMLASGSKWYDTYTIISILVQTLLLTYIMINVFHLFRYKMNITLTLASLALTPTMHEIYLNSVKPIVIEAYQRYKNKRAKRSQSAIPFTIIVFLVLSVSACIAANDGKVLSLRGKGTVVKGKSTTALKVGMVVNNGEKIIISDKSSATFLMANGRSVDIKTGQYNVSELIAQSNKGGGSITKKFASYVYNELTETSDNPYSDNHKKNMSVTGSVERAGGDRQTNMDAFEELLKSSGQMGESSAINSDVKNMAEKYIVDDYITVVMPRSSYLTDSKVKLVWNALKTGTEYKVRFLTPEGTEVLSRVTTDSSITVNFDELGLKRTINYYWSVQVANNPSVHSTEYCLNLLNENQTKNVMDTLMLIEEEAGDTPFGNVVKASYAEENGLHVLAVDKYNEAIRKSDTEDYKRYFRNYLRRLNLYNDFRTVK